MLLWMWNTNVELPSVLVWGILIHWNSQFTSIYTLQDVLPPWVSLGVLVRFYIVALDYSVVFSPVWFYFVALDYSVLPRLIPLTGFLFSGVKTNCFQTVLAFRSHQSGLLAELLICFTFSIFGASLGLSKNCFHYMALLCSKLKIKAKTSCSALLQVSCCRLRRWACNFHFHLST